MPPFQPAPATLPAGHRVYAIGDVHGLDARLARLHARVAADFTTRPIAHATLIHLGDGIDRGPDSAGVIARWLAGPPAPGLNAINLMGNHERMLLDALAGDRAARTDWLGCGGREALASWGADPHADVAAWRAAIPPAHLACITGLRAFWRLGGYYFVHAGVRPGTSLERQDPDDLLRIRGSFLTSERDFGAVVVHGHTPVKGPPELRPNRINIDTGAVFGRLLTCAVLEDDRVAFLQV